MVSVIVGCMSQRVVRNSGVSRRELTDFTSFFLVPHAGLLADEYGSYVSTFYMTGIVIVVSAAFIFLLPFVKSKYIFV